MDTNRVKYITVLKATGWQRNYELTIANNTGSKTESVDAFIWKYL